MASGHKRGAVSALLLLIASLGVMALLAGLPFSRLAAVDSQIEHGEKQLLRLQARALHMARAAAEAAARSRSPAGASGGSLITTAASGLAGARLQKLIVTMARANRGQVSSVQVLPVEQDGDLRKITVALAIRIDIKGLRDLLYEMETRSPLLFVETLSLRRVLSARRGARGPRPGQRQRRLDVILKVSGFMRKELQS